MIMRFASESTMSATRNAKMNGMNKPADSTETTSKTSETFQDSFQDYSEEFVDNMEDISNPALDPTDLNVRTTMCVEYIDNEILQSSELWFAECRSCPCCQGFKHGCMMCASWFGSFTCRCVVTGINGAGPPDDVSAMTANSIDQSCHVRRPRCGSGGSRKSGDSSKRSRALKRKKNRSQNEPCRFFFSAGGCRYGDTCSYEHSKR
mmetsp:Transcript_28370/g.76871  ORF Transcript_28370/g.76871 Transcript_28370/m.76871 type:complete len:206 (+) Transcript_28370:228-845(+)